MNLTNEDLHAIGTLIDDKLKQSESRIIKQMKTETKQVVSFFDEEYLGHDKRIKRIENHLGMSQVVD